MQGKPRVSFIIHGKNAVMEKLILKIKRTFEELGSLAFHITTAEKNASFWAIEAIERGANVLIAVGGDGTVNEVANAILFHPNRSKLKMGILPFGKGNDFVRSLGIRRDLTMLCDNIKLGKSKRIDAGKLEFVGKEGEKSRRYFVNIADVGLGGLATQMLRAGKPLWSSNLTYFLVIIKSFMKYRPANVRFSSHGFYHEGKVMSICMANGRYFASGLGIAPEAKLDDGKLDWVILGEISIWDYLKNIPRLKRAKKIRHPEVSYHRGTECNISSDIPLPIDMDGEFVGYTPMRCQVESLVLEIIA
ncbi:diacylglycerol kinase family lipid kinase [Mariniradius sp. RY-2]|uniref:Diacylglycerol kinase family lipid kinase n=2 Tax=Mariniradius sediminis TaxID=2909237 RepID=A0ABS9BXD7_9BACT|nr:diacylglycerol kinase family lipid kinase [Mariniradius sediminis]